MWNNEQEIKIVSIALSKEKGIRKTCVNEAEILENFGLKGDAHGGTWHRQISFLSAEKINQAKENGLDVSFGDFAENIATIGVDWKLVPVGTVVELGDSVKVEITQIGKKCHNKCEIYHQTGDCIMPREGVFGRVIHGGKITCGDMIKLENVL